MAPPKQTKDIHLSNGTIICWSRRNDPYVPIICGSCGQERLLPLQNVRRRTFHGICRVCAVGESWQDKSLPNGSFILWSRRQGQKVPVICGCCNQKRIVPATNAHKEGFTGFCRSCAHSGSLSTTWRGGRKHSRGYIYIRLSPDHPYYSMATKEGYVAEHRLVMAEHLGRPLENREIVHHKNEIKSDNRLDNLELFASLQEKRPHPGYEPIEKQGKSILNRLISFFGSDKK